MMNSSSALESLSSADLLSATRELVHKSRGLEAELLLHLGEVDERKLYLECAFPSMFAFCVEELGFSEDAAYARITVARAARRLPAMVEAVRSGQVHLDRTAHARATPHRAEPSRSAGAGGGQVEARRRRAGRAAFAAAGRSCADPQTSGASGPCDGAAATEAPGEPLPIAGPPPGAAVARRAVLAPLTEKTVKVQFTASRTC